MNRIGLFTGIHDLFLLKLANALSIKSSNEFYYFGSKKDTDYLYMMIDSVKPLEEKMHLLDCMDHLKCIEDEAYLGLIITDNLELELWHADSVYLVASTYNSKVLSYNEQEICRIERICKSFNVGQVNYLGSIYRHTGDDVFNLFFKIKEMNEGRILLTCKELNIKCNIYRTPVLYRQTEWECQKDYSGMLATRIHDFIEWVKGRIPNYFDCYNLHLLKREESILYTINLDGIISKILEWDGSESLGDFNTYHICGNTKCFSEELCKYFFRQMYNIETIITVNTSDLNSIDRIFDKLYAFHFPLLHEKVDSAIRIEYDSNMSYSRIRYKNDFGERIVQSRILKLQDNRQLTYYIAGSGPAILIINAYGVDASAWDLLVEQLSQHYYVIYWRSRGLFHNEKNTGAPDSYCGIADQIEDIEQIVNQEKLEAFHLISWCSGAKTAIFYNLKHPNQVLSQVFIAGEFAPFAGSESYHSKFRENIQMIYELIQNNERMLDFYMKIINKGMFNHPVKEYSTADEVYIYEIMPEVHRKILLSPFTSKETMVNFLMMCMEYYTHDVTEDLGKLSKPVLFISAECDQVAPYMQSKWAHSKVQDSKFICFPAGTHLLILERVYDTYEIIMEHMKYNQLL